MIFTVTYRGADGAPATDVVEAASRAECLAQMKARGIAVLGVKEGASASRGERGGGAKRDGKDGRNGAGKKPFTVHHYLFAAIAVIAAIALWWWMDGRRGVEAAPQDEGPKKPSALAKEVTPAKAATPKPTEQKPVAVKPDQRPKDDGKQATGNLPPGTVVSVRTNDNDLVITAIVGPDGKTKLHTRALHEPIFSNPSDQLIAAAVNASMTGQMAPLPLGPESDLQFKAALKKPILDNPDDSEEVKRMKQKVREAREQIAGLMEKGQSFAEILAEHRDLWNENIRIREGVVAEYRRIVRSGDAEEAQHYLNTMNTALGQMGIPPLTEDDGHSKRRKKRKEIQEQ